MSSALPDAASHPSAQHSEAVDAYSNEIGEKQDPERVCGDDWNFYEEAHDCNKKQREGQHGPLPNIFHGLHVNAVPKNVSAEQNPKCVIAKYWDFDKNCHDRSDGDYE
jgi:hypothetical protein